MSERLDLTQQQTTVEHSTFLIIRRPKATKPEKGERDKWTRANVKAGRCREMTSSVQLRRGG